MARRGTGRNPLLGMVLSGANAWMGAARGIWIGQAGKVRANATRQGTRLVVDLLTPPKPLRRRKSKKT